MSAYPLPRCEKEQTGGNEDKETKESALSTLNQTINTLQTGSQLFDEPSRQSNSERDVPSRISFFRGSLDTPNFRILSLRNHISNQEPTGLSISAIMLQKPESSISSQDTLGNPLVSQF